MKIIRFKKFQQYGLSMKTLNYFATGRKLRINEATFESVYQLMNQENGKSLKLRL